MVTETFDVVVVGTGPGGEGAAMRAAKGGLKVAMVERFRMVGGGCTHWGTIPSKALRHVIGLWAGSKAHAWLPRASKEADLPLMLAEAAGVIAQQVALRKNFYDRNDVSVFWGQGAFVDDHTLQVTPDSGRPRLLKAKSFILAPGSRPYRPSNVDFAHPRILDADKLLELDFTPRSITIYGAGVIGCEYASMFRRLGVRINLINTRDRLLSFLDDEISDALSYHLRDKGVVIRHNEEMDHIEGRPDGAVLHLKSGKKVLSDVLLFAQGRTGNTDGLQLDKVGIKPNHRGQLEVNENYQTSVPHIYAVGDVIGWPALASAAYDQGRFASTHIVEGRSDLRLAKLIPTGIYTSPEISSIGETERELTARCVPYEVGYSHFKSLARAQILGERVGMLKLLFHRETYEILGIHCFGAQASEIVHIGQAIMSQPKPGNDVRWFVSNTFNYPTMAEAYRVAALNGLNRLF